MLKNIMNKKRKTKGFTLIELIIVIAIIAILAAVAIPKYLQVREDGNVKADVSVAKNLANAVSALIADDELDLPATSRVSYNMSDDSTTAVEEIKNYMQNVDGGIKPKAKEVKGGNFIVEVTSDGNVIVSAQKNDSGTKYQILPATDATPYDTVK